MADVHGEDERDREMADVQREDERETERWQRGCTDVHGEDERETERWRMYRERMRERQRDG